MTQVTRTAEEIVTYWMGSYENLGDDKLNKTANDFLEWLTSKEPRIEDLRRDRPWKDLDIGEKLITVATIDSMNLEIDFECTESLSSLGLEFARIVQYLNGEDKNKHLWFAHLQDNEVVYSDRHYALQSLHASHYAKDSQTIKKAVEIFTPEQYKKMLGVK